MLNLSMEEIHQPDGNIAIGMLPENVALTVAVEAANQFDAPAGPVDGPSRPLSPREFGPVDAKTPRSLEGGP
jgi:hypothetical protein